jgi:hypothetical protein
MGRKREFTGRTQRKRLPADTDREVGFSRTFDEIGSSLVPNDHFSSSKSRSHHPQVAWVNPVYAIALCKRRSSVTPASPPSSRPFDRFKHTAS